MPIDDHKTWYEEALAASNAAGFVGLSAAQTIERQAARITDYLNRLDEIQSWICCADITSAEDLMQNAERILRVSDVTIPYDPLQTDEEQTNVHDNHQGR